MTEQHPDIFATLLVNASPAQIEAMRNAHAALMQVTDNEELAFSIVAGLARSEPMAVFVGLEADIAWDLMSDAQRDGLLG